MALGVAWTASRPGTEGSAPDVMMIGHAGVGWVAAPQPWLFGSTPGKMIDALSSQPFNSNPRQVVSFYYFKRNKKQTKTRPRRNFRGGAKKEDVNFL